MRDRLLKLKQLDHLLTPLHQIELKSPPKTGWTRTIRKALGVTIKQLAKRLNVSPTRVVKIEMEEPNGSTTLQTLKKVANALDCDLIYAFVPKKSFTSIVRDRAGAIATEQIRRTVHTMNLEAQPINQDWLKDQTDEQIDILLTQSWKNLWK